MKRWISEAYSRLRDLIPYVLRPSTNRAAIVIIVASHDCDEQTLREMRDYIDATLEYRSRTIQFPQAGS